MYEVSKLTLLILMVLPTSLVSAESVEINVVAGDRASFGAPQRWMQALGSVRGARIRSDGTKSARPTAKWIGSTLHVTAVIGENDNLILPGRKLSIRQASQLTQWIENQKKARASDPRDTKDQRFGLSARELQQVHDMLKPKVTFSTQDKLASDVLRQIVRAQALPVKMSSSDFQRFSNKKLDTEWKDLSVGTAVAAILRNVECVMVPVVVGGRIQLKVNHERLAKEGWPVGWDSDLQKDDLIPKIFDKLPIEIHDTPVTEVMKALEKRIETPIIFDEGLLSASSIDAKTVKIDIPPTKSFYGKVIRQAAFKAKMTSEVRVDETGRPF